MRSSIQQLIEVRAPFFSESIPRSIQSALDRRMNTQPSSVGGGSGFDQTESLILGGSRASISWFNRVF